jgi:hypothetical protein
MVVTTIERLNISIPFTATVTLDADLSNNVPGYRKLSQIFPDPTKRTFDIKGLATQVDWANAISSTNDITFDSNFCENQPPAIVQLPVQ